MRRDGRFGVFAVLLCFATMTVVSCARWNAPKNVILVTVDTLRADYLSCYNAGARRTPHIDQLAALGMRFTNAFTVMPITLPAHTAILASRKPYALGMFNNGDVLAADAPLLQELMQKAGYRTSAFVSLGVLRRKFGLARGFEAYNDDFRKLGGRHYKTAAEVNSAALHWIENHARDKFFAWIHYSDPHEPYGAPLPDDRFVSEGRPSARQLWKSYESEVQLVDAALGDLLKTLKRLTLDKRTVIVLLADHGEGLRAHGFTGHVDNLYNETTRIPLILYSPDDFEAGTVSDSVATLFDVAPTILDIVNITPAKLMEGRSLIQEAGSNSNPLSASSRRSHWAYACTLTPESPHDAFSVTDGRIKVIFTPARKGRPWEAFDLLSDPLEKRNLVFHSPHRWNQLVDVRTLVEQFRAEVERSKKIRQNPRISPEDEEMLKALGYTGQTE